MAASSKLSCSGLKRKAEAPADFALIARFGFAVGGNDDGRNSNSAVCKMALKFQACHVRHVQIDDQAIRQPFGQGSEKLPG